MPACRERADRGDREQRFNMVVYSLADPMNPQLVSNTPVSYEFLSGLFVQNSTAFAATQGITYNESGTVSNQFGDFLAVSASPIPRAPRPRACSRTPSAPVRRQ